MTSAQVVETSVDVITNSPSKDYTRLDDHTSPTYKTKFSCLTTPPLP